MPKFRSVECNIFQLRSPPNPSNPWRAIREVEEIAMPSGKECTVAIEDGHFGIKFFWTNFISERIHIKFQMDGRSHNAWNEELLPRERIAWASVMMDSLEYYNEAKKPCIRKWRFTPVNKIDLNNNEWEGYDQCGTIWVKVYRCRLRKLAEKRSLKATDEDRRTWDDPPSVSAADVAQEKLSHLITLDPELRQGGDDEENEDGDAVAPRALYDVIDLLEDDGLPYATFKFNFRSQEALRDGYVPPIEVPTEYIRHIESEREGQIKELRKDIVKTRQFLCRAWEDRRRFPLHGTDGDLTKPILGARRYLTKIKQDYHRLKYTKPTTGNERKRLQI